MSKNEFLLRVALKAMRWGEGADFEMKELIGSNGLLLEEFECHYGVLHPQNEPIEGERGWSDDKYDSLSPEAQEFYVEAWANEQVDNDEKYEEALVQCQKDACILLEHQILWTSKQSETVL